MGLEPMTSPIPVQHSTARTGLNFFSGLISTTTKFLFITVRVASIFASSAAVHIYDFP